MKQTRITETANGQICKKMPFVDGKIDDCKNQIKGICLFLLPLFIFLLMINPSFGQSETTGTISWVKFELHQQDQGFNLNQPHYTMMLDVYFGNLPVSAKMLFSMSAPQSMLYDFVFEDLSYRSSSIRNKTKTMQGIGNTQKYFLSEIDIFIGDQLLGIDNLDIYPTRAEEKKNTYKGILGFGMFLRSQQMLLIDNLNNRLAAVDQLPDFIEQNARFVPMQVESGFLKIPVMIDGKEHYAFYDGSARPALIVYSNAVFKDLATETAVEDQLLLPEGNYDVKYVDGFKPSEMQMEFAGMSLGKFDVYYSKVKQPGKVKLTLSHAFFSNYLMIFDYKNNRFGLMEDKFFTDIQKK